MSHHIEPFYDPKTSTITYVVFDEDTRDAVIIDSVLDYDPLASQTSTASAEAVLEYAKKERLKVRWLLETHAHADHLSGAQLLKRHLEAPVAIGENITVVQKTFQRIFDLPDSFPTDGSQFDKLLRDGEVLEAGSLRIEVIATPGHTPACVTFKIGDALFTGDALFMHDYGTGRCDFPKGSAEDLYTSVHEKLYKLPDATRVFVGHDYQPGGREPAWETTIGASKKHNPQLNQATERATFVKLRKARDRTLQSPRLLFQSVQVNVDGGWLPKANAGGIRHLRVPLNLFGPTDDYGARS